MSWELHKRALQVEGEIGTLLSTRFADLNAEERRFWFLMVTQRLAARAFGEMDAPERMGVMREWIKQVSAHAEEKWLRENEHE